MTPDGGAEALKSRGPVSAERLPQQWTRLGEPGGHGVVVAVQAGGERAQFGQAAGFGGGDPFAPGGGRGAGSSDQRPGDVFSQGSEFGHSARMAAS